MSDESLQIINSKAAWLESFQSTQVDVSGIVGFKYLHDMAVPDISGMPEQPHNLITINEKNVVRFGMLEGDAIVHAEWAVYDPQNGKSGRPFRENGSTAKHLALVLNSVEAGYMAGMPGAHPAQSAPVLASKQQAEVVVVKMGPEGAFVWTAEETAQVSAFKTNHVWKIGSGDCFVAHFANAWIQDGKTPAEAALFASRATAYYCDTQCFPSVTDLETSAFPAVELSAAYRKGTKRQVYLAGPFFDLAQVWMVQQTRSHLMGMGLQVFSPYHDIGLGSAQDVVLKDLEGIKNSDLVLAVTDGLDAGTIYEIGYARALSKPVVVYSERHKDESLKMMQGSGCTICNSYTMALYATLWEAVKI